jgi:arylsulfatase A-like enzyme
VGAQKSFLLVTVDCLRADHVGFMGYSHPTTPFLDSVAKTSFVVPNAIVAGTPTYYSLPAILASRFPLALGRDVLGIAPEETTLATVLQRAGYSTACFIAANPYISPQFGYERGFDRFCNFLESEPASTAVAATANFNVNSWASCINKGLQKIRPAMGPIGRVYDDLYFEYCQRVTPVGDSLDALRRFPSAEVIVDHALEWLSSIADAPFFLWLHFMDPHSPYYPKESALASLSHGPISPQRARYLNSYWNRGDIGTGRLEKHRKEILALYDAGIRWVDEQLGRLFASPALAQRWQDCLFAITADHGEEFLDHGGRYHPPSQLTEELIHVPLLLRIPGIQKTAQKNSPFSLIHLAPTVLDAMGQQIPVEFQGASQLSRLKSAQDFQSPVISECVEGCTNPFRLQGREGTRILSVRDSRYKLVMHFDANGEELYDLECDPKEQHPLSAGEERPVRRRLLEAAREHLRRSTEDRDQRSRIGALLREHRLEWQISSERVPAP